MFKKKRKIKFKAYWLDQENENKMPKSILMTNAYLLALVKKIKSLENEKRVYEFF